MRRTGWVIAVALALAACGGGGGDGDDAGATTADVEDPGDDFLDACALLSAEQVNDETGFAVLDGQNASDRGVMRCNFVSSQGNSASLQVMLGKALADWEDTKAAAEDAGGEEVAAGDEGVFTVQELDSVVVGLVAARVGDDIVVVTLSGLADAFTEDAARTNATNLVNLAADAL